MADNEGAPGGPGDTGEAEAAADAAAEDALGAGESAQGTDAGANTGPGVSAGPGQEADEGTDRDLSMDDEIDYSPYESEDLEDMQDEFDKRQADLPTRHKANAIAIRNELAKVTDKVNSKNPANLLGITYQKDRYTEKEKQDMVQAFRDKHEDTINTLSKAHSKEMDAQRDKKGMLKGAYDATKSPAGMVMGFLGGPLGLAGMALTGLLTEMGLNYTAIDIETDLDSLMQQVGLKEKDAQSDVSDPDVVFLKAECEERDGYRWDDAMATCVVDTIKKADPIDVVNPY
jgi:hypothetical protein